MALRFGKGGELSIILQVKDNGTLVVKKFADETDRSMGKAKRSTEESGIAWGKLGAAAGLAAAGVTVALGAMVKSALDTADATSKTAAKLGLTTEALSALHFVAEQASVSTQTFDMAMQRMTRRVAEAAQGTGEAKDALTELRLDTERLAQMSPDQQYLEIAEALSKIPNQADRVRLAFKLFDSEGVAVLNTMRAGKQGIIEWMEAAQRTGRVISTETGVAAERFTGQMKELRAAVAGFSLQLAEKTLPVLLQSTEALRNYAQKGEDAQRFSTALATVFKSIAHIAIGIAAGVEALGTNIGAVAAAAVETAKFNFKEAKEIMRLRAEDVAEIEQRMLESQKKLWEELPKTAARPP